MENSYVGILVDGLVYSGIKRGYSYFERLAFYEEAGKRFDLTPCFFRLRDISPESEWIQALVKETNGRYKLKTISVPSVIHNRGLFFTNQAKVKLLKLQQSGITIFNGWNRYGKMTVHEILMQNEELRPHLPETKRASVENLKEMMKNHNELMIKPNSGSLGGGIMMVEKKDNEVWTVNSHHEKVPFTDEWPEVLRKKAANKYYLIQQRIPLAKYQGSPFDLRVSVQKNGSGKWQVTGIVGKVAKSGSYVTNVAKGGTCKSLKELVSDSSNLDFDKVYHDIENFSIKAVEELAAHFPSLADVGLDIGLTEEGFPMFIECNGRDLRITFGKAGMVDVWKATHTTPISYARYLLDLKIEQE
ncbi:YheC/YheD family protein [Bacillus sp. FJAT-29814]|uniref:YheC/YheD family endospore coat-associated protein n=1 Tax=Bacillus sp. FJAT-29814 TaxID=1729688 RepID=UPI00082F4AB8|nr:YheC/YheD family protein [Bacillus sp. FJAT-29814]